ncbi:MAG TPA: hypothetical protein VLH10_25165 [Yinghuangia sp.]|nr:hypothetical protein [Yinghuangia sp.]
MVARDRSNTEMARELIVAEQTVWRAGPDTGGGVRVRTGLVPPGT